MAETQNLTVTDVHRSISHLATPSRRNHRHKRSFAISGDFEFLKQPPLPSTVPSVSTFNYPQTHQTKNANLDNDIPKIHFNSSANPNNNNNTYTTTTTNDNNNSNPNIFLNSPLMPPKLPDSEYSNLLSTPNKKKENLNTPSPRFFISEEPRFSSPIKGVPDAIINLDDALKTRPRSFKSHRRSESAPAGLEIVFDPQYLINNPNSNSSMGKSNNNCNSNPIKEEDDVEDDDMTEEAIDNDDDTTEKNRKEKHNTVKFEADDNDEEDKVDKIRSSSQGLMSPMRPSSPIFQTISRNSNVSPIKSKLGPDSNDRYNSMKIKGQKQRYYHYTKQFTVLNSMPTSASSTTSSSSTSNPFTTGNSNNNSNNNNNLTIRSNSGPVSNTQSQSLKQQTSMTSLSSNVSKTPLSFAYTPSTQQMNTPSTPISYSEQKKLTFIEPHQNNTSTNTSTSYRIPNKKSWTDQTRRQMSPGSLYRQLPQTKGISQPTSIRYPSNDDGSMRSSSGTPSSFNFESKIYDISYDDDGNKIEDNSIDEIYNDDTIIDSKIEGNELNKMKNNKFTLSQDILLGEPGDVVDLSSPNVDYGVSDVTKGVFSKENEEEESMGVCSVTPLSTTPHIERINLSSTIDRSDLVTPPPLPVVASSQRSTISTSMDGSDITSTTPMSRKMEVRSISDGIMQMRVGDGTVKSNSNNSEDFSKRNKRKSRLSVFINNLFK